LKYFKSLWIIIGVCALAACTTVTPTPTATVIPTETAIPPTPDRPIFPCDSTQLIKDLRESQTSYDEIAISQVGIGGDLSLTAWFVDPELDPQASQADLLVQTSKARRHAVELAQSLALSEPCMLSTFFSVTLIAVDPHYNLWYEGAVNTSALTLSEPLSEEQWLALENEVNLGFMRETKPLDEDLSETPVGSCDWPEARENLEKIFAKARINVSFYYTIGDEHTVWVQWDVPPVALTSQQISDNFFEPLPKIDAAVSCLYPPFDSLWMIYVHQDGEAQWIFAIDGDAVRDEDDLVMLDNLELIYPLSQ
jgi:hypothetical protein